VFFSYCALSRLALLGRLSSAGEGRKEGGKEGWMLHTHTHTHTHAANHHSPSFPPSLPPDLPKANAFVGACRNFDGGFGCVPGAESHAGQVWREGGMEGGREGG